MSQSDATVEFRYGYTGREQDNETGLDYYRARYYDASNSRFISEDPLGFSAGDSNLSRYVHNNPVNLIDPFGLRDMRWPSNGSVKNETSQPIYPLISNSNEDHYEQLNPGDRTPDAPGRSKDVDGVWVLRNLKGEGKAWYFYPVDVPNNKHITVRENGVFNNSGKQIQPWDPVYPAKNLKSCPNYVNGKVKYVRGRESARIPPNISKKYLDATTYVEPEDNHEIPTIFGQIIERGIKGNEEQMKARREININQFNSIKKILNLK